ncbi:unnamed protein product [Durusdinium trenchii]|uniref:RING-type domain-containing protein n=1 Tax=Durusdinium trenchii TaxID=1381693 RepID=A0ABP0HMP2_9DINO
MQDSVTPQDFYGLRCNWASKDGKDCKNSTDAICWITSCQHVLCDEHAKLAFASGDSCPICGYEAAKVIKANLSREGRAQARKGLLPGLTPSEIMDSAARNIEFWVRQKALECMQRKKCRVQMEKRSEEMSKSAEEQIQVYQRKCQQLEEEQVALQKKLDDLESDRNSVQLKIQALQRDCSKAEQRCERVHRQMGQVETMLPTSFGLRQSQTSSLPITQGLSPARGDRRPEVDSGPRSEPRVFNFEGAHGALSPGRLGVGAVQSSFGHFFDHKPSLTGFNGLTLPGSPKRGPVRSAPLNSAFFGSARMSRRRIT